MDASRRTASVLRLRFSIPLANRPQRLSQAIVRSTIGAFWEDHEPFALIRTLNNFCLESGGDLRKIRVEERPLMGVTFCSLATSHMQGAEPAATDDKINALKRATSEIADRPLGSSHHIINNATACQHDSKIRAERAACNNRLSGEIRGGGEITRLRAASPAFNKSSASA
jgi:hypothetical protein